MSTDFDLREALCREYDPELWFPVAEPGTAAYDRLAAPARAVCAACPVRAACLEWADAIQAAYGIFGGLDPAQRRARRAARAA